MSKNLLNLTTEPVEKTLSQKDLFQKEVKWDQIHALKLYSDAKRQQGTHKTKGISEISGTGKKPFAQKGTGRARQGSLRSAQMRGGATIFGPLPRSHAFSLNKKQKKSALLSLISAKNLDGKVLSSQSFEMTGISTKAVKSEIEKNKFKSVLFVDGINLKTEFDLSTRNLPTVGYISQEGLNVNDLLKYEFVCFSKDGLEQFVERITNGKK